MNRIVFCFSLLLLHADAATAQTSKKFTDAIGTHNNYGRGCSSCHVPHSPSLHNKSTSSATFGCNVLWGEEVMSTNPTIDDQSAQQPPISVTVNSPEVMGVLMCLSCHDGIYARSAMMKNTTYVTTPDETNGAIDSVPTFMEKPGVKLGPNISEHPVGLSARVGCGGAQDWDCTQRNGVMNMEGRRSSRFVANYGFFLKPHTFGDTSIVVCTTCHNPHSMNAISVTKNTESNLYRAGIYATRHFLRAPFNPGTTSRSSNESAQFCRQCHADMSNEMNGSSIGTSM